jgi:hypothetical protein
MLLLCGALVGFALITGSITTGSAALPGPGTIRLTSMDVKVSLLNRGARSRGAGDVLLIRQLLFNKGIRKAPLGHADLVCTYTGPRARQCSGTYSLPRGAIVVYGSVRFRAFFKLAVVSGTKLYDNVRGSLIATNISGKPRRELLIFRLVV